MGVGKALRRREQRSGRSTCHRGRARCPYKQQPAFRGTGTEPARRCRAAGMVSKMKKCRKNAGFTMVELMMVVAIVTILLGVAAVNVIKYQRALKGKEADSAAKEIFIAAQNHLTAADALGELERYRQTEYKVLNNTLSTDEKNAFYSAMGTWVEGESGAAAESEYLAAFPARSGELMELMELMLPFGAIDEHVRTAGSYIIHYNLNAAKVLDVFYSDRSDGRFGTTLSAQDYAKLTDYAGDDNKANRRKVPGNVFKVESRDRRVIGWYGSEAAANLPVYDDYLKEPTIKVINADTLRVEISQLSTRENVSLETRSPSLSLIVTGVSSGARKEIRLVAGGRPQPANAVRKQLPEDALQTLTAINQYVVVLDDVTTESGRFHSVMMDTGTGPPLNLGDCSGTFIPGEDLDIRAVAFDNTILSNIAESGTVRVNSLFGSLTKGGPDTTDPTKTIPDTVSIYSFRHLENLDSTISRLDWGALATVGTEKAIASADRIGAKQVTDLDWTEFLTNTQAAPAYSYQPVIPRKTTAAGTPDRIPVIYDAGEVKTVNNTPVSVSHSIRNLSVSTTGANAGLFDTLPSGSSVSNLDLVNFNVTADGYYSEGGETVSARSGALAGKAEAAVLTNVKVYNDLSDDSALSITGSGSVGGLVGEFTGSADGCAAAVYVKSTGANGSAGGLFGTATATATGISNSYSGGHTVGGKYKVEPTAYTAQSADNTAGRLNVMGSTAGGLIGTLSGGTVENCYTTCSAGGTTVGGFVGNAAGGSTDANCYCTGLVAYGSDYKAYEKPATGASVSLGVFAGSASVNLAGKYLDLVNYFSTRIDISSGSPTQIVAEETDQIAKVGSLSNSVNDNGILAFDSTADSYNAFIGPYPVKAVPYDDTLLTKAEKDTSNVPQFGLKPTTGQTIHYGDWPIYETLVVNT